MAFKRVVRISPLHFLESGESRYLGSSQSFRNPAVSSFQPSHDRKKESFGVSERRECASRRMSEGEELGS